jgi:DNA-binding SARP family transcriptional activator
MFRLPYHLAREQLQNIDAGVRLVVIHPNYIPQHVLYTDMLETEGCAYVRFEGKALNQAQLEAQLEQALQIQHGNGRLAGVQHLLLDECDNARLTDLEPFLAQILDRMPEGRVIIVTRRPPMQILTNEQLRQVTGFVPVDESMMLWDYARRADDGQVLLEVRALGNGRVLRDGISVDSWDGLLPRALFFYLVDKGMTTRNDIFATFWPNLTVREATNVFHVTKRKISEVLGVDLTEYWSGFYHISPEIELSYDVVRFSELLQDSAVASLEDAQDMLRRSVALYRDNFLMSLEMPWVQDRRRELRQSYGEALISLGRLVQRRGGADEALGLYLRALTTNPQREDVTLFIMKLYQEMGMLGDALQVYQALKHELDERLHVEPNPQLQELAGELERIVVR